jgi:hypothetical protein
MSFIGDGGLPAFGNKLPAYSQKMSASLSGDGKSHTITQMVTHPDTNHAQCCLPSVINLKLVHSVFYYQ